MKPCPMAQRCQEPEPLHAVEPNGPAEKLGVGGGWDETF